jgi:hypothetical protein
MNYSSLSQDWSLSYTLDDQRDPFKMAVFWAFFHIHRIVSTKTPHWDKESCDSMMTLGFFDFETEENMPLTFEDYTIYLRQLMLLIDKSSYFLLDLALEDSHARNMLRVVLLMKVPSFTPRLVPCADYNFHISHVFPTLETRASSPLFISELSIIGTLVFIYRCRETDLPPLIGGDFLDQKRMDIYHDYNDSLYSSDIEEMESDYEYDVPTVQFTNLTLLTRVG